MSADTPVTHRLLVTGSRDWENEAAVARGLETAVVALCWHQSDLYSVGHRFVLVSGACPTGADAMAERLAADRGPGWSIERHPADWNRYGKAAGPRRNAEMVSSGVEAVIAFQRNYSRGTDGTIELARAAGIPVFIWSQPW